MDDKTTPTPSNPATPPSTPPLTAPPISPISSPSMSPTPSSPAAKPAPAAPIEMEKPVEHDIVSSATTPAEPFAPISTPEFAASEPIPSNQPAIPPMTEPATNTQPAQSTPAASTIPPMPPLETQPPNPATPSAPTPAPQPMAPTPTPSPEVPAEAVKADQTPSDVPVSTNQTPSQDQTTPAEPDKAKKSKALIGIIIALVLIALILGGLVIWRAMQPTPTAAVPEAINEAVLPPEMQQAQEPEQIIEEIVEEEIVAEPTDPTADWETYSNGIFTVKHPAEVISREQQDGVMTLNKTAPDHPDTELIDGISLTFQIHEGVNITPIEFAKEQINKSIENELGELLSGPEESVFNGHDAAIFAFRGLGTFTSTLVKSPRNNTIVVISNGSVDPNNYDYQETVDQILSTFEFTD